MKTWRSVLIGFLLVAAIVGFSVRIGRRMPDFDVYRTAAARAIAAEPLYRSEDGHWQFKYLPAFALAVAPVALLPTPVARAVWFGGSLALLVVLLTLSVRLLPDLHWRRGLLVTATVIALGKFYAHELELGQSNILLALVAMLAVSRFRAGREAQAGVWLAVATIVKPYAIVFLPYLAARQRWRAVVACLLTLAAAIVLPAVRYGASGNWAQLAGWWTTVTTTTPPNLLVQDNISIPAMYAKWLGVGATSAWLGGVTAMIVLAACAWMLRVRPAVTFPEYLDVAVLLMLVPLVSPQGWDYVLLVSTPAVMLLINHLRNLARPLRPVLILALAVPGLTLWDIVGRQAYHVFMVVSVVTFCALVQLAVLLRLRARQVA